MVLICHENWTLFTTDCCIRKRNNSNSKTCFLNFLSLIEDVTHVLLITGLSYSFSLFVSRYFFCDLVWLLLLHIYFFPLRSQLTFCRMCHKPAVQPRWFAQNLDIFDEMKSLVLHFIIDSIYTKDLTGQLPKKYLLKILSPNLPQKIWMTKILTKKH